MVKKKKLKVKKQNKKMNLLIIYLIAQAHEIVHGF